MPLPAAIPIKFKICYEEEQHRATILMCSAMDVKIPNKQTLDATLKKIINCLEELAKIITHKLQPSTSFLINTVRFYDNGHLTMQTKDLERHCKNNKMTLETHRAKVTCQVAYKLFNRNSLFYLYRRIQNFDEKKVQSLGLRFVMDHKQEYDVKEIDDIFLKSKPINFESALFYLGKKRLSESSTPRERSEQLPKSMTSLKNKTR